MTQSVYDAGGVWTLGRFISYGVVFMMHRWHGWRQRGFPSQGKKISQPIELQEFNIFTNWHKPLLHHRHDDTRHEKTDLKVFVIVIPKEGWACVALPILLLVWHRLFRIWVNWLHRSYSLKVGVIPKEGWARPHAPILLLVTTKTLSSVLLWRASW